MATVNINYGNATAAAIIKKVVIFFLT